MGHLAEYPYIFRENMNIYLSYLDECIYRKYGSISVDMLVAGGSAIIIEHNFRNSTEDIDTYIRSSVDISSCISEVSQMYSIPEDWVNSDFVKSNSFSKNILTYSDFVCKYTYCLSLYKVCDLDLFCMKLVSFRPKDYLDLKGIYNDSLKGWTSKQVVLERLNFLYGSNYASKLCNEAYRVINKFFPN